MKLRTDYLIGIGAALILIVILSQALFSKIKHQNNLEALSSLIKPESGRALRQDEILSGQFHNLKLQVYGLSCISCSDAIFYGLVNIPGVVNADIHLGKSCIIYDSRVTTPKELLASIVFSSGIYMAKEQRDTVIRNTEDTRCL